MDAKHTMEERGDNYTLTVADVRQQDLGEYTCSAVNKIGEAQATVLLTGKQKKKSRRCQLLKMAGNFKLI